MKPSYTAYGKPDGKANWKTLGEMAEFLGVHRQTVTRMVRRGLIPAPEYENERGWKLWSPDAQTAALARRSRA